MAFCKMTAKFATLLSGCVVTLCLANSGLAFAQVAYPEQEVRVHDLPAVTAKSPQASHVRAADVLAASLEMLFNDHEVCCGKDSALYDTLQSVDAKSLKDIGDKLQGRHLLSDGRPIAVTVEYLTPDKVEAGHMIAMIRTQRAALMMWNSHLYVVEGVTYVETVDSTTGSYSKAVHKFLLQDARFSDARREVVFDRLTEDLSKVQGLLFVQAAPQ